VNTQEHPVVFDCEGSELVGVIHMPEQPQSRGMLAIVAGGPQYRGGVGRLQVQMARRLAAHGIPVMRFDYRGLGDGEGRFRGFEDVEADLRAAIRAFRQHAPQVNEVVLWGGCDAAAAIMINAWKVPEVTGIITGNPWVHTEATGDAVVIKHHYRKRMKDLDFWLKVVRLQYNPLPAAATLGRNVIRRLVHRRPHAGGSGTPTDDPSRPFVTRMRAGLRQFKGDMLLLMSGRSLVSKEFDELVASDPVWQLALRDKRSLARHDMPEADQTYSSIASRGEVIDVTRRWMLSPSAHLR
jgi:exosortase A-associated hydrolase 1